LAVYLWNYRSITIHPGERIPAAHEPPHGQHRQEAPAGWTVVRGDGPILATAIHDGSALRAEAAALMRLSPAQRLHEEDPHTGEIISAVPTRVVAHRSRFEVDLNRSREEAVYRTPAQAWGLEVWKQPPTDEFTERSLMLHDRFYDMMRNLLDGIVRDHGRFILLDVHSYNHRRDGPGAAATPCALAPDINLGTASMPRQRWTHVLDALTEAVAAFDYRGRQLEVGRDVAFQGRGALARFVHSNFPQTGCAIAFEVKKFFMDEWTGVPYREHIAALQRLIAALVPALQAALARG
jgi:hypothetical protein